MALEATVDIRGTAIGGDGVGAISQQSVGNDLLGITAFVPYTAAGDTVRISITERKKNYVKGSLIEIITPSADRVEPYCSYFGQCGGCELQHISYEAQLRTKHSMLLGAMKAARLPQLIAELVSEIVPSSPFAYRRRITLHLDGQGNLGFYRPQSRSVVSISKCVISVTAISESIEALHKLAGKIKGNITSIVVETDSAGLVAILKSPYELTHQEQKLILDSSKEHLSNVSLVVSGKEVGGFGRRIHELPLSDGSTTMLRVPAGHFSQVNWGINRKLIKEALETVRSFSEPKIIDLFAGAGNFSIPMAQAGGYVTAIETDPALVELAKENTSKLNITNRLFFKNTSVENFLKEKHNADIVMADPPRSGLGNIIQKLPKTNCLILIFCHTPSMVRDLKNLIERGWKVEKIVPFDMFAQTSYLETLVVLRKPQ